LTIIVVPQGPNALPRESDTVRLAPFTSCPLVLALIADHDARHGSRVTDHIWTIRELLEAA